LSVKVGKEAGLVDANATGSIFSLMGSMGQTQIKLLEIGEVKATNISAIVLDHPTIGLMSKAFGSIEGIVGFPFFARFSTTIDYQAKRLTLTPNGFEPPDVLEALAQSMVGLTGGGHDTTMLAPVGVWGIRLRKNGEDLGAGVTVAGVLPGSPAAAAGLQPDDRLLTIDGRWTDSVADVFLAASRLKPGAIIAVVILRAGKEMKVEVQPATGL
jgi:membrane-associated protease RseP (regulator of RpoE activity)